ncbi:MAG: PqqD family protein [Candidatus Thermoplasmatota archaeon]|jgi:hypothetical protein|nr:PqqD family protein [Candidatus Thermoplasmatota archaeon]
MTSMPPLARERTSKPADQGTEGADGQKVNRGWWRSSDDELVSGRVKEVGGLLKGLKGPPPGDKEVEEAFDEASNDPMYRNLLDMVPARTGRFGRKGKFLLVPIYKSRMGNRFASLLRLRKERKVRLDTFGWAVWELCDGKRDVMSVGEGLKARFGRRAEPLYPRLTKFLAYLVHLDLIVLEDPSKERP